MQNHNNDTIKTCGHSSLEKYTSHFIERVVCERELETKQRLQHIALHQLFWLSQPFFPILLGCSTESLGIQPLLGHGSHSRIFSPTHLNFLSPGLYNSLTSTLLPASVRISYSIQPLDSQGRLRSPDIFDRMHLLFTQEHFLFWQLGRGQYATLFLPILVFSDFAQSTAPLLKGKTP